GPLKIKEKNHYSFKEYLELEAVATDKHEYHDGQIFAMTGGTVNHGTIANSVGTAIDNALDKNGKDCTVLNSDVKIRIEQYNKAIYPDASVVCGEIEHYEKDLTLAANPILLIEVLSKSTKEYDKGEKFEMYRSIPSFKEYMVVYQTIPKVQTWYKETEDLWRIGNAEGLDQSIMLYSIGCEIALKDIYKRIRDLKEIPRDLSTAY
ncbi:MAG: Uma2 family endonuclease, partial [Bacteroidota bacterium]